MKGDIGWDVNTKYAIGFLIKKIKDEVGREKKII